MPVELGPVAASATAHWYLLSGGSTEDLERAARKALDSGGHPQRVHVHPQGQECDTGCTTWSHRP